MTDKPNLAAIGRVLKAHRKRCGLKLREVAKQAGPSIPYISELERGKGSVPTLTTLYRLCARYGVHLSQVLAEADGVVPGVPGDETGCV